MREGRAKLTRTAAGDEAGLKPHQTLLQWYLDGEQDEKWQTAEGEGGAAQTRSLARQVEPDNEQRQSEESAVDPRVSSKRQRTEAVGSEVECSVASKRQRAITEHTEQSTASLTGSYNVWDALADG